MGNDKRIRELTAGTAAGTDYLVVDQGSGAAKRVTVNAAVAASATGTAYTTTQTQVANLRVGVYNVLDYGAVGDGSTDDTPAIQACISAAKAATGAKACRAVVDLKGKSYKVTASLDITDTEQLIIEGHDATITSHATNKAALDLLGSARCVIRNVRITGDSTNTPKTLISLGRSTDGAGEDSGHHLLENVQLTGGFSIAGIYDVASEINTVRHCWILPSAPNTVKYGIHYSSANTDSIGSDFATRSATASAACMWIENVNIGCQAAATQFIPVYLGPEAGNVTVRDSYLFTYNDMPAIRMVGNSYSHTFDNVLVEGTVGSVIHLAANSGAGTQSAITVRNVAISIYTSNLVLQDAGTTCYGLEIVNCRGQDGSNASNITLSGSVYGAHIDGWYTSTTGTVTVNNLYGGYLAVADHTVTVATTDYASQIVYVAGANANYTRLQNVKVGLHSDTTLARVKKVLKCAHSVAVGDVLSGANWNGSFTLTGATSGSPAFVGADKQPQHVQMTVLPYDGGGFINLTNHGVATWEAGTVVFTILVFVVD